MWRLADRQIDEFLARGECEFIADFASPFTLLVIADLLGVPEEDHEIFQEEMGPHRNRAVGERTRRDGRNPLSFLSEQFSAYVEDRRHNPRRRAHRPRDRDLPRRLVARGHRRRTRRRQPVRGRPGDHRAAPRRRPAVHRGSPRPPADSSGPSGRIPNFIEEALRIESPVKADFRLSRVPSTVGSVDVPAGTTVMVLNGAANRDPRRFESPESSVDRQRPGARVLRARDPQMPGRSLARAGLGSSSACSTAWPTSGSPRRSTAPRARAATSTTRRSSCGLAPASTGSSAGRRMSKRQVKQLGLGRVVRRRRRRRHDPPEPMAADSTAARTRPSLVGSSPKSRRQVDARAPDEFQIAGVLCPSYQVNRSNT